MSKRAIECIKSMILLPRAIGLAREIERSAPDCVHLFWGHYPALVAIALAERRSAIPITMFLGAYDLEKGLPYSRAVGKTLPLTTHARTNLKPIREFLGDSCKEVRVTYRGVNTDKRPGMRVSASGWQLIVVERLVQAKRTAEAIAAFKKVHECIPDSRLAVYGDGPQRAGLEEMSRKMGLAEVVSFKGHVDHGDVLQAMANSHILLSMSQSASERLPNVVKEAMAQECIPAVARTPGIEELIADWKSGVVVEPGDVSGVSAAICYIFRNVDRYRQLSRAGRRHMMGKFNIRVTSRNRIRWWHEVVSG